MLRKILGAIGSLALIAIGVALMGGWLTADHIDTDAGRGKSRFIKSAIVWLNDTLGAAGGGALVSGIGLVIMFLTLRPSGDAKKPKGKKD